MASHLVNAATHRRPEVHGHRGCRGLLPENTIPAFLHAITLGVEVLELDVIISADQQVVVSHEPWLSARLGTGPTGEKIDPAHERAYNLYQWPYSTIKHCVVGLQPHPEFPLQKSIASYRPLLRDVLLATESACQSLGRPPVNYSVEVKSDPTGDNIFHPLPTRFVELVVAELQAAAVDGRTTLLSFDLRILRSAKQLIPAQNLCLLTESEEPFASLFQQLGFLPDTLGPAVELLSAHTVQNLRMEYPALRIVPWTVNEIPELRQVMKWEVDGITTDYPDRLLNILGALP